MLIIHDKRLPEEYKSALGEMLPDVMLIPFEGVPGAGYESISHHPDIYVFQLKERTLICAPGSTPFLRKHLGGRGIEIIEGSLVPGGRYPRTVPYNAVRLGDKVFCRESHTDPVILREAKTCGFEIIDESQGYTRCSTLAVACDALVTSDAGIHDAALLCGMDSLKIEPGFILLPGEKYGFLGGAGGLTPDGDVVILGDLSFHRQGAMIEDFIVSHGAACFSLSGLPLYDAGGLIIIP